MSKHSESHGPNSPCHPGCEGWEEPTAHEETRARQTGATVEQLRRETEYAQRASRIAQWLDRCDEDGMTSLEIAEAIMAKVTLGEAADRLYDAIDQDLTEAEEEGKR